MSPLDLLLGYRQVWMAEMPVWAWLLGKITLLLALAWLIHVALERQNPRWRILLWRGAAVAMIVLGVGTLGLPGLEIRLAVPPPVSMQSPPSTPPIVAQHDLSTFPAGDGGVGPHAASRATTTLAPKADADDTAEQTAPTGSVKLEFSWRGILLGIWSIVPVLMAARLAVGYVRIVHLLKHSPVAPDWVCAEVERVAAAMSCRLKVQVRTSPSSAVPFLFGFRHPVLVLPRRMCEPACRLPLSAIASHELVHVQSWDFGWNAALQVMSIALWFHPLAWRIGWAHRAACDAVCDAVSASFLGDVPGYCRTLAQVALEGAGLSPMVGLAMARTCDVRRRIAQLDRKVFSAALRRRAVVGSALTGLLVCAFLAGLRFALAAPPPTADSTTGAATTGNTEPAKEQSSAAALKIAVQALDASTGKPLVDVPIDARTFQNKTRKRDKDTKKTDAQGNVTF
ncbi:MAG: M56 family metallopeptidase [Thermoguttaceae bacterium]